MGDNAEILALLRSIDEKVSALSLSSGGASASGGGSKPKVSKQVRAFDTFISSKVAPFTKASAALGGHSEKIGTVTEAFFKDMRNFLDMVGKCKKPSQADMMKTAPLTAMLAGRSALEDIKADRKNRDFINHAKSAVDGIGGSINWMLVPGPIDYLKGASFDAHMFWANKIRTQYKNSDDPKAKQHIEFLNTLRDMLKALITYVEEQWEMGVIWNANGSDALSYSSDAAGSSSAAGAKKKKMPPPISKRKLETPGAKKKKPSGGGGGGGGLAAVFAQINQVKTEDGKTVPPGGQLRKVTKDMKTKYRKDGTSVVKAPTAKAKTSTSGSSSGGWRNKKKVKNPRKEKKGNTWYIDEYDNETVTLSADECDRKLAVYIYGCENSTIIIEGKVNSITLDACKKSKLKFNGCVGSAQIVGCQRVQVQVDELCPSFSLDKTDGILLYVSAESKKVCSITHSKCSEMNVSFPNPTNPDEGWIEKPIPEQFVCKITDDGKVTSDISELYSS